MPYPVGLLRISQRYMRVWDSLTSKQLSNICFNIDGRLTNAE